MNPKTNRLALFLALPLLLSACGGEGPKDSSQASKSNTSETTSSSTTGDPSSQQTSETPSGGGGGSTIEVTSIDYTEGWSDELREILQRYLAGRLIPDINFPGEIRTLQIDAEPASYSSEAVEAHLMVYSTGNYDRALAGQAKLTYEKAGWTVDFNANTLRMSAQNTRLGIKVELFGLTAEGADFPTPELDIYFSEPFEIPEDDWDWSTATLEALESIEVMVPHMLPYVYLGTRNEQVTAGLTAVKIKGGSWDKYSTKIIAAVRKALPRGKSWIETSKTLTGGYYDDYADNRGYVFTKTFSDGYKVVATLYGYSNTYTYDYYYDEEFYDYYAYLEVTCKQPN